MDDSQCRVCLAETGDQISVFATNGVSIAEQLFAVTTVQILETDSLSKTICKKCCNDTSTAYELKMKCLSTDMTLRKLELKMLTKLKEMEEKLLKKSTSEQSIREEPSSAAIIFDNPKSEQQEQAPVDFDEILEQPPDDETDLFTVAYIDEDEISNDEMETQSVTVYEEVEYLESDAGEEDFSVPPAVPSVDEKQEIKDEEKKNICTLCPTPFLFKHEFSFKRHLWDFHENIGESDPMVCETCNFRFHKSQREDTLIRLIQKHKTAHENGKFRCCIFCPELFKSQFRLDQHIEEHKKRLQSDSKTHHKCKACGKLFSKYEELNAHLNQSGCRETHERPFKCFICNISFAMGIKKKEHIQKEHQDKAGADCPLCTRCKIPSALAFENHYSTHFEAPRFTCPYCTRPFFKSDRLQTHIRRSHEQRKFECNWCGQTFHDKGGISRHILGVHFNRRNFQCDICQKTFAENYNLKEHKFSVHKQASKFYTCSLCSSDFLYRAPFERHKKACMGPGRKPKRKVQTIFVS